MEELGERTLLEQIAREAGGLALEHFGRVSAERKGGSIVSEADRAVERLVVSQIRSRFPGDYILAEESGANGPTRPGSGTRWWAVDPIDGTGPYLSGLPFWSVSLACLRGSTVRAAAVYVPVLGEMFSAEAEGPALRNGEPLPPMRQGSPPEHCYLFVPCRELAALKIDFWGRRLALAAASLHLLYTATGSAFGTVIEPNCAYDFAAASLILERAGGGLRYASGAEVDYASLANGGRAPEPLVGAAARQVKWLCRRVRWEEDSGATPTSPPVA